MAHVRKVLILGAGFSYPLGLPLANQVLPWLRQRSHEDSDNPFTQEALAETDFWVEEAKACGMVSDPVDFESFLAFLQSAASLWKQSGPSRAFPRPPQGWADHLPWPPDPGHVAKELERRFLRGIVRFHDAYLGQSDFFQPVVDFFKQLLAPGDAVLTFNFDSIVERSLYWALGRGKASEGKHDASRVSTYHLHGCAEWMLYELPDGKDDDPEATIQIFPHMKKTWKLRKIGGEFDLNPYKSYSGLRDAAVQMVPYKSIPWFLSSQWEQGLAALRAAHVVIVVGYSFPTHDSAARYGIRTALAGRTDVKALNVDPNAADATHQRTVTAILGPNVEFIPTSWCKVPTEPTLA